MLKNFKNTFKHTLIYSIGNLSAKLVGFILLPLYTSHLSTADYGMFALLEITSQIMVAVLGFKLSTAMMRWCSSEEDEKKKRSIVFTNYIFTLAFMLTINLLVLPFHSKFSNLYFNTEDYAFFFKIIFISAAFEILNYFPLELIRLKEKSLLFITISVLKLTSTLTLNIYFIAHLNFGIKGILYSMLIGNGIVFLLLLPFLIKNMHPIFQFRKFKQMFSYGMPLVFSTIAIMLLNMGDRFIIKYLLDFSFVGIYSLGYKIASVINMLVIQSFQMGFLPIAYKMFDKPDANRFFSKTLTYYVLVVSIFCLVLSMFSKEVIELFSKNEAFNMAYKVVPFFCLAFILRAIQYVFSLGLHFSKKTKYNPFIVLIIAVLNIGLNFLLIPVFDFYGALIATIICWILMVIGFYIVSQKYYKVNYEINKVFLIIVIIAGLFYLSHLVENSNLLLSIPLRLLIIVCFPFILKIFSFYEAIEIERIKGFWNKWKNPGKWAVNLKNIKLS